MQRCGGNAVGTLACRRLLVAGGGRAAEQDIPDAAHVDLRDSRIGVVCCPEHAFACRPATAAVPAVPAVKNLVGMRRLLVGQGVQCPGTSRPQVPRRGVRVGGAPANRCRVLEHGGGGRGLAVAQVRRIAVLARIDDVVVRAKFTSTVLRGCSGCPASRRPGAGATGRRVVARRGSCRSPCRAGRSCRCAGSRSGIASVQ